MTQVAFYAPMKPPCHPVPSGDRTTARALLAALDHGAVGWTLVSTLQTRDGAGDAAVQNRLFDAARAEAARLVAAGRDAGWRLWLTYHCHYKAPDLLGPTVAGALDIPYVQIEASRARKRLTGPWAAFARAAETASDVAQVIFALTEHDAEALSAYAPPHQRILPLRPFLPRTDLPPPGHREGPMLSVGMLRHGDKTASYALIAETLGLLRTPDWQLLIAGDGPARAAVSGMMQAFGSQVELRGALDGAALQTAYETSGLLFWPGVNEAFGMSYLEAQASGLPVVAQDRPGVRDVLAPGPRPTPRDGAEGLARQIDTLLADPATRHRQGDAARAHIATHHLLGSASRTLCDTIAELTQ